MTNQQLDAIEAMAGKIMLRVGVDAEIDAVRQLVTTVRERDAEIARLRQVEELTRRWFADGQRQDGTKLALLRAIAAL